MKESDNLDISISYAITVKDELEEVKRLINTIKEYKRDQDEIVVLYDQTNGSGEVVEFLEPLFKKKEINLVQDFFENHFARWKNLLSDCCKNDFIFQIDADEYPHSSLLENLPELLKDNDIDVYLVPRVNTVEGITEEHIKSWGWQVNNEGWINWPDLQWRIYRNSDKIRWKNKVHEILTGFDTYSVLPSYEELALYHPKQIDRQERQNKFYSKI